MLFHIGWLCRKTAGNINRPLYPYIAAIRGACPASSVFYCRQLIYPVEELLWWIVVEKWMEVLLPCGIS